MEKKRNASLEEELKDSLRGDLDFMDVLVESGLFERVRDPDHPDLWILRPVEKG
ncbi:MAG: hypothetical protein MJZ38_04070 [archaeon]|nr:hypothetical protein [archaeon]